MKNLKVNFLKISIYYSIFMIIVFCLFYFPICKLTFDIKSIIIIIVFVILYFIFFIGIFKTFTLSYDNKALYYKRLNKQEVIYFDDILYIDEPYSLKHKSLTIYDKKGQLKFIDFDKEKKILDIFKQNCKNTITREEFQRNFPTIKL